MHAELEKFETGWVGIFFGLGSHEINSLIDCLEKLRDRELDHFHFTGIDFSGIEGIADVEIYLKGDAQKDNMSIP